MRDTIDMARESWIDVYGLGHDRAKFIDALKHFECLVRADERDDILRMSGSQWFKSQARYDEAIRARGNT